MIKIKADKRIKLLNKNWWNPTKKEWAPSLLQHNKELWPRQVDYEGKPWKALSPSYQKWKAETYGSLPELKVSGRMLESAYIVVRGGTFKVETTEEGVYNQFGTERMPARPWMGVPQKSLNKLSEIALNHILR